MTTRKTTYLSLTLLALTLGQTGCVWDQYLMKKDTSPHTASKPMSTESEVHSTTELPSKDTASLAMKMAESLEAKDNREADAIAYYERARKISPELNDRCSRRLAVLYDKVDNQSQALIEFQELVQMHPKDSNLHADLGYSYYNRGQWNEAEQQLRKAVTLDKSNKRAWVNLGLTLAQQGRYDESLQASQNAVGPAEAFANLGFVLTSQQKIEEAKVAYRKALEYEPTLKKAQLPLAKLEGRLPEPGPVIDSQIRQAGQ